MHRIYLQGIKSHILFNIFLLFIIASISPVFANGEHEGSTRPDSHAPIGVMGDHAHGEGELMISYRFMRMGMNGLRDGTNPISTDQALKSYQSSVSRPRCFSAGM